MFILLEYTINYIAYIFTENNFNTQNMNTIGEDICSICIFVLAQVLFCESILRHVFYTHPHTLNKSNENQLNIRKEESTGYILQENKIRLHLSNVLCIQK